MVKEFEYIIEGKHVSGKTFRQEFLVIAKDEVEAKEELKICLDYYEPVKEWEIISLARVEDSPHSVKDYNRKGPSTVYDPEFHFIDDTPK